MIINNVTDIKRDDLFFDLTGYCQNNNLLLKLEGLNIAGSIKLRSAKYMIDQMEQRREITPGKSTIVVSSSGNFAIAASLICKVSNYKCICVSDPNFVIQKKHLIALYGAEVVIMTERDENGGFLGTRLRYIDQLIKSNPDHHFLDQYANIDNVDAHYDTAKQIHQIIGETDYWFIGAGTTGTIMGCAKYIKENNLNTKLIAVDAKGSVTFGYPAARRLVPGLGTSQKPPIADSNMVDKVILVDEIDTIQTCHEILKNYGLLLGGSSGTVLYAIKKYCQDTAIQNKRIVAISPDFGDKYMETVYSNEWVEKNYCPQEQTVDI